MPKRSSLSRVARLWAVRGEDAPDQVYVRLPDEMDMTSAGTVVAAVREIPAGWPIVFDVRSLAFVDVAGAGELVQAFEEATASGRKVLIRGPFAPGVARLLGLADGLIALES
jgi:anti-anti-sigma regulatory factor